ncbi:MAG: hypothetical protein QOF51_1209 [Chloroflexota bacterium]|nr:hypothetical protein [Chloroflexota bacterium]
MARRRLAGSPAGARGLLTACGRCALFSDPSFLAKSRHIGQDIPMGKEKGFALSPVKTSVMRRFLERSGYVVQPGHHKHLKLRHEQHGEVLLPLKPSGNLSQLALKQIASAMGMSPDELVRQAK